MAYVLTQKAVDDTINTPNRYATVYQKRNNELAHSESGKDFTIRAGTTKKTFFVGDAVTTGTHAEVIAGTKDIEDAVAVLLLAKGYLAQV